MSKPTVVCLCGSGRYQDAFREAMQVETLEGNIVLTPGVSKRKEGLTPEKITMLERLQYSKIDLCDELLVLNVNGFIGEHTEEEIVYAKKLGKVVRYWEIP